MKQIHLLVAVLLSLTGCAPSEQDRRVQSAGAQMAARIWQDPRVAGAINLNSTVVADNKPGAYVLFRTIALPLGMATYGVFDTFNMVMFDDEKATHAEIVVGMRSYCTGMGRSLVQVQQGKMSAPRAQPKLKQWAWAAGSCR